MVLLRYLDLLRLVDPERSAPIDVRAHDVDELADATGLSCDSVRRRVLKLQQ